MIWPVDRFQLSRISPWRVSTRGSAEAGTPRIGSIRAEPSFRSRCNAHTSASERARCGAIPRNCQLSQMFPHSRTWASGSVRSLTRAAEHPGGAVNEFVSDGGAHRKWPRPQRSGRAAGRATRRLHPGARRCGTTREGRPRVATDPSFAIDGRNGAAHRISADKHSCSVREGDRRSLPAGNPASGRRASAGLHGRGPGRPALFTTPPTLRTP